MTLPVTVSEPLQRSYAKFHVVASSNADSTLVGILTAHGW